MWSCRFQEVSEKFFASPSSLTSSFYLFLSHPSLGLTLSRYFSFLFPPSLPAPFFFTAWTAWDISYLLVSVSPCRFAFVSFLSPSQSFWLIPSTYRKPSPFLIFSLPVFLRLNVSFLWSSTVSNIIEYLIIPCSPISLTDLQTGQHRHDNFSWSVHSNDFRFLRVCCLLALEAATPEWAHSPATGIPDFKSNFPRFVRRRQIGIRSRSTEWHRTHTRWLKGQFTVGCHERCDGDVQDSWHKRSMQFATSDVLLICDVTLRSHLFCSSKS